MKTTVRDIFMIIGEEHQVQFSNDRAIYRAGCVPLEQYDKPVKSVEVLGDLNALEYLLDGVDFDEANPQAKLSEEIILKITLA